MRAICPKLLKSSLNQSFPMAGKSDFTLMKNFIKIADSLQALIRTRQQVEKLLPEDVITFPSENSLIQDLNQVFDSHQTILEHKLQKGLGIEEGDWDTLYKYFKF